MTRPWASCVGVGPQVQGRVGRQHDRLEQLVEVELGLGRDVDEHRVAAVLLGHQAVLGQLAADLGRVGVRLVDLVDRDHDRHVGRLGVVERLDRLRHDAVVGRDHEDRDVGRLRAAGTHGGERLVTGGVDEGDAAVVAVDLGVDLVGTDVLGDATGLLVDDVGVAQRVEELGLAVVDVTHDGHDRRTDDQVGLVALVGAELEVEGLEQLAVLVLGRDDLDDVVELLAEQLERLGVDRLGRGDHLAEREQHLHQRGGVDADLLGEVGQGRAARQANGLAVALADAHATDRRRLHLLELLTTRALRLATATRRPARATEGTLGLATTTAALARDGHRRWGRSRRRRGHRDRERRRRRRPAPAPARPGAPGPPPGAPRPGPRVAAADRPDRRRRRPGTWASSPGWGAACRDDPRRGRPAGAADAGRRRRRRARGRAPDGGPCPGSTRTGCCPDAARRAGRPGAGAGALGARGAGSVVGAARRRRPPSAGRGRAGSRRSTAAAGASGAAVRGPGFGAAGGRRLATAGPRRPRRPRAAGLAAGLGAAGLAGRLRRPACRRAWSAALAASSASPYCFLNFISTGSSIVEEGDLTNSPISFSFSRTSLLSMP